MALYVRPLTEEERRQVEALAGAPANGRRARVVLRSAEGWRVTRIAAALGLSDRTVREVIHRFNREGAAALPRRKAPGARRQCSESERQELLRLLREPPAAFGRRNRFWTAPDLLAVARELGIVGDISTSTLRREVRRAGCDWKEARRWPGQSPPPGSAGSAAATDG